MRRADFRLLLFLTIPMLAGCGAMSGSSKPPPSGLGAGGTAGTPQSRVESAREEYYLGVKAYVREDFEEAESRFLSSIALLEAPLPEGTTTSLELDEAETLLTKSNYFLQKISEQEVAEIEIPMVTLRFPDADPQSWGINFMRDIRRKNEQVFWAPIPRAFSLTRVSLAGSLNDLQALDRGLDLRVKPYVTGGGRYRLEGGVDRDGERASCDARRL